MRRVLRSLAVVALVGVLAGCGRGQRTEAGGPAGSAAGTSAVTVTVTSPTTDPPATEPPTSTTTTTVPSPTTTTTGPPEEPPVPPPPPEADGVLEPGDTGPAVAALQDRLESLGYWLGSVDGVYGTDTLHAVTAFQKAEGLGRDGVAGPQTMGALAGAARVRPVSTSGHVVEVDLARQIVVWADGGRATWVFDTSTGVRAGTTPVGHWTVIRQVDGWDTGPYGPLYRPRYFTGDGVGVHGYDPVPSWPASHGCVRVTMAAIDFLWASGALPMGGAVWVH